MTHTQEILTRKCGDQKGEGWLLGSAKRNDYQARILYPAKQSFKSEDEIKTFSDKTKSSISKPILQEIINRVLQATIKGQWTVTQMHRKK